MAKLVNLSAHLENPREAQTTLQGIDLVPLTGEPRDNDVVFDGVSYVYFCPEDDIPSIARFIGFIDQETILIIDGPKDEAKISTRSDEKRNNIYFTEDSQ